MEPQEGGTRRLEAHGCMGRKMAVFMKLWADVMGLRVRGTERPQAYVQRGAVLGNQTTHRLCLWVWFSKMACPLPTPPVWLKPVWAPSIPSPRIPCFSHRGLQWFCFCHVCLGYPPFHPHLSLTYSFHLSQTHSFSTLQLQLMFCFLSEVLTNVSSLN